MSKSERKKAIIIFSALSLVFLIGALLTGGHEEKHETVQEVMRDSVLHDLNKISLLGIKDVNPGLIAAFTVSGILIVFALICRIFVIPRFKLVPGKFQMLLETIVGLFDGMAKSSSEHINSFLGAYIFTAGTYIFTGTLFELFGVQAVTTAGHPISLPAPLSDVNGAIMMGISMSFRLFGALLSGALVTELVYYYSALSYVLPVIVGVLFTLLHALIQAYVLTMLTSMFYGEVAEKSEKKPKDKTKTRRGKKRITVVKQDRAS